ncbi:hypothetical protein [uncultured Maribacter sp.]|uniref:hypothetical protein n=1 Tax=uncultured Maribacter sp. TaxID=431308 RepID=UPI0026253F32|nr:hypothetical protein [uncultured Maribacter sp.]
MKTLKVGALVVSLFFVGVNFVSGQEIEGETDILEVKEVESKTKKAQEESIKKIKITKYTVMSSFEPEYVIPAEERIEKKKQRIVDTYRKKEILDTLDISERKRKRLMRDLRKSPFSDRLSKATIVDTKFEDEDNLDEDK